MPFIWQTKIAQELKAAGEAHREGNDGKARACARRAAGIILSEWDNIQGRAHPRSALDRLKMAAGSDEFPEPVRKAAQRLVTNVNKRLSPEFTFHPINDAQIVIRHVEAILTNFDPAIEIAKK